MAKFISAEGVPKNTKGGCCRKEKSFMKAQTGMETYAVFFILILVFVYVFITYTERNRTATISDNALKARLECYRVASLINRVRANGQGFNEHISFTTHLIKIYGNNNGIQVFFEPSIGDPLEEYYCSFPTSNITNSTDFTFELIGNYKIANEGDNITFYKV